MLVFIRFTKINLAFVASHCPHHNYAAMVELVDTLSSGDSG